MVALPASSVPAPSLLTANERFKRSFDRCLWGSMMAATLLHFLLFQLSPVMTAADFALDPAELEVIPLLPDIELPPEPAEIPRPARPVEATFDVPLDQTMARTDFVSNPPEGPPPPPSAPAAEAAGEPRFTPRTVEPGLVNRAEVERALLREYPAMLRDARIGGSVLVWFYVDEEGRVRETRLARSSGNERLDGAALRVADVMRFRPALNRDQVVAVWVALPVTFRVP